jgi:glycosyltransferase involved in cell wall biosynthesis
MRIVLYTGYHTNPWNPDTIHNTGLGGTEQSVLYLAKSLVLLNRYKVWVVGNVIPGDYDGVHYRTTEQFKNEVDWVNTIIGISYIHYIKEFEEFDYKNSIFWVHNTDYYTWWKGEEIPNHRELLNHPKLSKIVCLTYWHKRKWLEQFPETQDKVNVISNGIDTKNFVPMYTSPKIINGRLFASSESSLPQKVQNQFIYSSHAERGLAKVLEDWPLVKQTLPNATLKICTPEYGLEYFKENFLSLISNLDDVEFVGTLPQQELYQLMSKSHYWYYPSTYEETFCITALEMLGHKVIPMTWEWGGLKETLHGFNVQDFDEQINWRLAKIHFIHYDWKNITNLHWIPLLLKLNMNLNDFTVITLDFPEELSLKCSLVSMPNDYSYRLKQGFYYQDLNPEELAKFGVNKHPNWNIGGDNTWWNRDVTDGEIGCSLSHVDTWIDSYTDEKEITMILEEDFIEQLPVPWDQVEDLLSRGYDLIYLGRNALNPENETPIEGFKNWVEPDYSYNTHAYILSKRGVELLVDHYIERYKNKMFVIDEFFSVVFKKTQRTDILEEFSDLPTLKAAAPIINFFEQSDSKGLTQYNIGEGPELPYEMPEIMNAGDWGIWCSKYINPHILSGQYRLMVDEIGPNIIEFPLFTDKFCEDLIQLAESKTWVTDRHEYYPTTDQTMESLGMQDIYQAVLENFVYPIFTWYWELEGDNWNQLRSENFIAKYDTENQGSLNLHHDISLITLNVRLNDEFTGGGTFLPKYKLTIQPKKRGNAMAHPGMITHKHGGRPVDSGTRYILVSFTQNP